MSNYNSNNPSMRVLFGGDTALIVQNNMFYLEKDGVEPTIPVSSEFVLDLVVNLKEQQAGSQTLLADRDAEIKRLKSVEHTLCLAVGESDKAIQRLKGERAELRDDLTAANAECELLVTEVQHLKELISGNKGVEELYTAQQSLYKAQDEIRRLKADIAEKDEAIEVLRDKASHYAAVRDNAVMHGYGQAKEIERLRSYIEELADSTDSDVIASQCRNVLEESSLPHQTKQPDTRKLCEDWKPINQAPDEESRYLVSDGHNVGFGWRISDGSWFADDAAPLLSEEISLYMPIPIPQPAPKGEDSNADYRQ
ncbi:hypothetical protein PA598K_01435 [Paenibacillus sp. 598K]|uniref:hypothetical protein n=1 Tax=Paenibacillus sp. 598K TaxID=1117987 RepID=UPI000FFA0EFC|nr:hypothetical protein [Paenibacillus sp. 598K]GBF73150.1 hypothetical protein PA598K_01435 [Paenibacillus sp. 598K]